jgi:hypothetical protein
MACSYHDGNPLMPGLSASISGFLSPRFYFQRAKFNSRRLTSNCARYKTVVRNFAPVEFFFASFAASVRASL